MAFPVMPTRVNCPQCKKPFMVELHTVVDVGQEPDLKEALLRGGINSARCPECGAGGMISTPILYHDPAKDLLISFVPPELGMKLDQQEKFIGGLVKAVMDSLPVEKRKAYFFQPKTALTMEGMFDTILEADGVSREALAAQRARLRTMNALLNVMEDEKTFADMVKEHQKELDYEFLLLISNLIDANEQDGNQEAVTTLQQLRDKVMKLVDIAAPKQVSESASNEDLIKLLLDSTDNETWRSTIAMNRPRLDYGFFQALTGMIDAAETGGDTDQAEKLTALRERILEEIDTQENMMRSVEDQAVLFIMDLCEAQDLKAMLLENRKRLNDLTLNMVARYRAVAQASGNTSRAEKLQLILDQALDTLESDLPPDARLINRLMRAEHPEGTNRILEENRGMLNEALLATVDKYIENLRRTNKTKLADHLQNIRAQMAVKQMILRA
ncbi:MAG: CpXC domain-containing protein [Anaerolineae bacterium]